jgi:hypothetical protein
MEEGCVHRAASGSCWVGGFESAVFPSFWSQLAVIDSLLLLSPPTQALSPNTDALERGGGGMIQALSPGEGRRGAIQAPRPTRL